MQNEPPDACRVAICDDVAAYRLVVRTVLGMTDGMHVVGEAENGVEAIELVTREQPDVLLLDLGMPVMDGLEALAHIRVAAPHTRVVMLTGYARPDLRARALESGAVAYLEKGIKPEDIVNAVLTARSSAPGAEPARRSR